MSSAAIAPLSGTQKSAVLLLTLGDEKGAQILKHLPDDEVQSITHAIATLPPVSLQETEAVLEEFYAQTSTPTRRGGLHLASRLLESAFGPEGCRKHLDKLPKDGSGSGRLEGLQQIEPARLARFLEKENPQLIALVMAHLSPDRAAALLRLLPTKLRRSVAIRLARLDQTPPEIVERLSAVISKELHSIGEIRKTAFGGLRSIAAVCTQLDPELSEKLLEDIGAEDANLVEAIRTNMFVFEDLLQIDTNGIKEVLGRVDRKVLTLALKGASEQLKTYLFAGMSKRGADMLREDIEALGPVKIKDVETARNQVTAVVRQLEVAGVLSLKGVGQEQYVV